MNFGIALAMLLFALLNAPVKFCALLGSDASDGSASDPHDLRFLRFALLVMVLLPAGTLGLRSGLRALAVLLLWLLFFLDAFFFAG